MALNFNIIIVTTSPYTITSSDTEIVFINRNSSSQLILPSLSGEYSKGRSLYIKDASGTSKINPITITAPSGKLIDGVSFAILNTNYSHMQVVYDGVGWKTIS